jgi:hypothetical protein
VTIQNLAKALANNNPAAFSSLTARHPGSAGIFAAASAVPALAPAPVAKALGPEAAPASALAAADEGETKRKTASLLLDLAQVGVADMQKRLDDLLEHVLARMTLASRIKLVGAIAATAAGLVSGFLTFAKEPAATLQLVTAGFSFVGGLVTILADQVIRSPSGLPIASSEEHGKILATRVDVERIALRLARTEAIPVTEKDLTEIIEKLDEISVAMIRYQGS